MAADLDIRAYVALLERNQRPVTADMLLRLACTYKIDLADLAGDGGADHTARMQAVLKEPMFADIDIPPLEISDIAIGYPGLAEAFLRLYTAYREEQLALADRRGPSLTGPASGAIRMQRSGCGSAALSRRSPQQFRRSRRCRRTHSAWSCGSGLFIERLRRSIIFASAICRPMSCSGLSGGWIATTRKSCSTICSIPRVSTFNWPSSLPISNSKARSRWR
jgi:transcriptional regulator with XRE-family HTH domain